MYSVSECFSEVLDELVARTMNIGGEVPDSNNNRRKESANVDLECQEEQAGNCHISTDKDCLAKSTDEDVMNPCSPCLGDDPPVRVDAVVYCLKCEENLCLSCKKQHRRFKSTSNHSLIDRNKNQSDCSYQIPSTEHCLEHTGSTMDFYCENDGVFCCKLCVDISHSHCTGIKFIPDEAKDVCDSPEVRSTGDTIAALLTKLKGIVKRKKTLVSRARSQEDDAQSRVLALTNIASGLITKLAEEAKEEIHRTGVNLSGQLRNEIETCEAATHVLNALINKLEIVVQSHNEQQIYIMLKETAKQVAKYTDFVSKTDNNTVECNITFVTDQRFESMLQSITSMGSVNVLESGTSPQTSPLSSPHPSPCSSKTSLVRKKAIPIGGQSVRIAEDRTTCHVSGCKFLPDGRIAIADYNNKCLKLFESNFRLANYVRLASRPTDLVLILRDRIIEVATSLADEHMIQYVKVGRTAFIGKRVQTCVAYSGLSYSSAKLMYASCICEDGSGQIHVINLEGNVLRTIKSDCTATPLLVRPSSIYVDDDRNVLYVTDLAQNCVVCLDANPCLTGNKQPLFKYSDRNLELRTGMITADNDDNLYVCSGNQSVHQISLSCQKIYEILTSTDGISLPQCLAFSAKDSLLLLSEYKENGVKLFKMN